MSTAPTLQFSPFPEPISDFSLALRGMEHAEYGQSGFVAYLIDHDVRQSAHDPFPRSFRFPEAAGFGKIAEHFAGEANTASDASCSSRISIVNVVEDGLKLLMSA